MSHSPKKGITIYAPESDYDSKTIACLLGKFWSSEYVNKHVRMPDKSQFQNTMKKKKDALKIAVEAHLKDDNCVIFVIDRDGPMAQAARKAQSYSLRNQIHKVVDEFRDRVHLVKAINEIEAWLLIDCVGIFCYFAKGHHFLGKECSSTNKDSVQCSPECREKIEQKFKSLITSCQKGDTQTIEEPVSGGKGVKEYLQHFAKEIYKGLHEGNYAPKNKEYTESKSPEIARYIEINSETLKRNESLRGFLQLIIPCMLEATLNEELLEYLVNYKQDLIQSKLPVPSNYKGVEEVVVSSINRVKITGKEVATDVTGEMKVLVEQGLTYTFSFAGKIILDKGKVIQKGEELRVWVS